MALVDADGWFPTRDAGSMDEAGYLFLEGRADDVIGEALGRVNGPTLTWTYDVDLDLGNRTQRVTFDDVLFLQDERTLLNQADVKVGPVAIGMVTLNFTKL